MIEYIVYFILLVGCGMTSYVIGGRKGCEYGRNRTIMEMQEQTITDIMISHKEALFMASLQKTDHPVSYMHIMNDFVKVTKEGPEITSTEEFVSFCEDMIALAEKTEDVEANLKRLPSRDFLNKIQQ